MKGISGTLKDTMKVLLSIVRGISPEDWKLPEWQFEKRHGNISVVAKLAFQTEHVGWDITLMSGCDAIFPVYQQSEFKGTPKWFLYVLNNIGYVVLADDYQTGENLFQKAAGVELISFNRDPPKETQLKSSHRTAVRHLLDEYLKRENTTWECGCPVVTDEYSRFIHTNNPIECPTCRGQVKPKPSTKWDGISNQAKKYTTYVAWELGQPVIKIGQTKDEANSYCHNTLYSRMCTMECICIGTTSKPEKEVHRSLQKSRCEAPRGSELFYYTPEVAKFVESLERDETQANNYTLFKRLFQRTLFSPHWIAARTGLTARCVREHVLNGTIAGTMLPHHLVESLVFTKDQFNQAIRTLQKSGHSKPHRLGNIRAKFELKGTA